MKILLVNPSQLVVYEGVKLQPSYPPVGLLYVATILEERNHSVSFIDMDVDGIKISDFPSILRKINPDIVGLTATTPTIKNAFAIASEVKKHLNIPVMLGGIHATCLPAECIARPDIDFLIQGEGENTVTELFGLFEKGGYTKNDLLGVKGLWFKHNGESLFSGPRPLIEDLAGVLRLSHHYLLGPPE